MFGMAPMDRYTECNESLACSWIDGCMKKATSMSNQTVHFWESETVNILEKICSSWILIEIWRKITHIRTMWTTEGSLTTDARFQEETLAHLCWEFALSIVSSMYCSEQRGTKVRKYETNKHCVSKRSLLNWDAWTKTERSRPVCIAVTTMFELCISN